MITHQVKELDKASRAIVFNGILVVQNISQITPLNQYRGETTGLVSTFSLQQRFHPLHPSQKIHFSTVPIEVPQHVQCY